MRISGRVLVVVGVCALVAVAAVLVRAVTGDTPSAPVAAAAVVDPAARSVSPVEAVASLAVLRDWDHARAEAWAAGDRNALRRLYVGGSAAGRRDVALLERWRERGLRVEGMAMQVFRVRLHARTASRIVLVVTDRLLAPYAVGHGRRYALPHDNASTRRLEFRRVDGRWLLAVVGRVGQTSN